MRKFKYLFMTMLAVAVCCGFTACGDDDDEDEPGGGTVTPPSTELLGVPTVGNTPDALLGKWTYSYVDEDGEAGSISFQFKHRGICSFYYDEETATLGSCKVSGNKLTVDLGSMIYEGPYSISGDKLIFKATASDIDEYDSYTMELTLKKVSSETGFEPSPVDDALVGAWYDFDRCHRFTFLSNGLAQYLQTGDGYDTIPFFFAYSVNNGELSCYDSEGNKVALFGSMNIPYTVNGNTLSITGFSEDGSSDTTIFTK